jgi:hypothetical protein
MDHILLQCYFSREVWHLQEIVIINDEPALQWWLWTRKLIPKPIRRGFDSLFFLIGSMLWKERNVRTFNRTAASAAQLVLRIHDEAQSWCVAGNKQLRGLLALL